MRTCLCMFVNFCLCYVWMLIYIYDFVYRVVRMISVCARVAFMKKKTDFFKHLKAELRFFHTARVCMYNISLGSCLFFWLLQNSVKGLLHAVVILLSLLISLVYM